MQDKTAEIWLSGAFAAFTVDLLVYPLDTLKTRIQAPEYRKLYTYETAQGTKVNPALFRGVYQGLTSAVIATLPSSGAFFITYEKTKHFLSNLSYTCNLPAPVINSAASGVAECVSCAILTPAEVIKQNAQMVSFASEKPFTSPADPLATGSARHPPGATRSPRDPHPPSITARMLRQRGLRPPSPPKGDKPTYRSATLLTLRKFKANPFALWRGYGALTTRNLPFTALQFPMYERLREYLFPYFEGRRDHFIELLKEDLRKDPNDKYVQKRLDGMQKTRRNDGKPNALERATVSAMAAGSAGSVAAVVTTPIDVVKTRIMLSAATGFAAQSPQAPEQGKAQAAASIHKLPANPSMNENFQNLAKGSRAAIDRAKQGELAAAAKTVKSAAANVTPTSGSKAKKPSSMKIAREVVATQGWKGLWRGGALRGLWTMLGSGLYLGVYEGARGVLSGDDDTED